VWRYGSLSVSDGSQVETYSIVTIFLFIFKFHAVPWGEMWSGDNFCAHGSLTKRSRISLRDWVDKKDKLKVFLKRFTATFLGFIHLWPFLPLNDRFDVSSL
jgi:hypothetical protein